MKFHPTGIAGVMGIELEPHRDERGFFARLYEAAAFRAAGIDFTPADVNLSHNIHNLTLRGMHYQVPPFAEAKVVRAVSGRIFDVVVDLREDSPTKGKWISMELSAEKANALFIPEGCAHGFLTLEPMTDVLYQMGRPYVAGHAAGYRWDDPAFGISWPAEPAVISEADRSWPAYPSETTDDRDA